MDFGTDDCYDVTSAVSALNSLLTSNISVGHIWGCVSCVPEPRRGIGRHLQAVQTVRIVSESPIFAKSAGLMVKVKVMVQPVTVECDGRTDARCGFMRLSPLTQGVRRCNFRPNLRADGLTFSTCHVPSRSRYWRVATRFKPIQLALGMCKSLSIALNGTIGNSGVAQLCCD